MNSTLNPGLIQSLATSGQQADAARRQREMMLAQQAQQDQQRQQQSSVNPNMLRQFMSQPGITASPGYTSGGTATSGIGAGGTLGPFAEGAAGGLGGLGGLSVSPAFIGGGTATSGLGAGGSLGAFAQGGSTAGGLGGLGGGASAAGGGGSAMSGLAAAGPWAALAAAIIGNETYAKNHGYRRGGSDYYKDLATGRVLSQDVDNRWAPMLFGKNDRMGLGKDMSFAADLGSFQFGKAFKDLKGSSLFTGFGLFK